MQPSNTYSPSLGNLGSLSAEDFTRLVGYALENTFINNNDYGPIQNESIELFIKNFCPILIKNSTDGVPLEIIESWARTCISKFRREIENYPSLPENKINEILALPHIELYNNYAKPYVEKLSMHKTIDLPKPKKSSVFKGDKAGKI